MCLAKIMHLYHIWAEQRENNLEYMNRTCCAQSGLAKTLFWTLQVLKRYPRIPWQHWVKCTVWSEYAQFAFHLDRLSQNRAAHLIRRIYLNIQTLSLLYVLKSEQVRQFYYFLMCSNTAGWISKCIRWSDAVFCGIRSGSALLAQACLYEYFG